MKAAKPERAIFDAAVVIADMAEREDYLHRACGDDTPLRRQIEVLLAAHSKMGNFLKRPSPVVAEFAPITEKPGTTIGPYRLLDQIGEGGFGLVFVAEQLEPVKRQVALKLIKPGMDSREVLARFTAERQALALMDHPNIAKVLDAGATTSGRPYFVMELVRGIPMTEYCDQKQLSPRERLGLFVEVCQAVQHAHQKGIIHRDLKPSNILVSTQDDQPAIKVIDFGVAKAIGRHLSDQSIQTQLAQMIGTPLYMSPEQAQLGGDDIDTRSDIYSLGVLLYELLTGATPFDKTRLRSAGFDEIRRIIREDEPIPPSRRMSMLGKSSTTASSSHNVNSKHSRNIRRDELDWVVMKALEKDRQRRYETASALASDVRRYLNDEPVLACPPTLTYRLRKTFRRHKGPIVAAAFVTLALVGGIIGTTWEMIRALGAEHEKSVQLWRALVEQAKANRMSRRPGQRFETLDIVGRATQMAHELNLPAGHFRELRNVAIAALALPDMCPVGPWHPWPAEAYQVDFDSDFTIYARTDRQGNCSVRRMADDAELHFLAGLGANCPATPLLSRDGAYVAVSHQAADEKFGVAIDLWQLDGAKPKKLLSEVRARWFDFAPDMTLVAVSYVDNTVRIFALPSGQHEYSHSADPTLKKEMNLAFHPSEPLLAVWSYLGPNIQLRELASGKVVASIPQSNHPTGAAWHPDGETLAVGYGEDFDIRVFDRTTLELCKIIPKVGLGAEVAFNHAGDRLLIGGWGNVSQLFDMGTGQKLFKVNDKFCRRFSRDDRRIAGMIQNGKLGLVQIGDGRELQILVRNGQNAMDFTSIPRSIDGQSLAAGMRSGFGLWDLDNGSEVAFVPSGNGGNCEFVQTRNYLLTLSSDGLFRWPLKQKKENDVSITMGPAQRLPLPPGMAIDQSADGRVIVTSDRTVGPYQKYAGGWIWHTDQDKQPIRIDEGADVESIAVSPDGRWVVTANHRVGLAKLWDARDGRFIKELVPWGANIPRFSQDGRWLSFHGGKRLLEVGSWTEGPDIGNGGAFSPDNVTMASPNNSGHTRLVNRNTGEELAVLEAPTPYDGLHFFTPDGAKLVELATAQDSGIRVWNLRLIRQQLKKMDLDWTAPELPPAEAKTKSTQPPKVKVLLGDFAKPEGAYHRPVPK